jgi:hypothetical protein
MSPVELTDGEEGKGRKRSQIVGQRENMVFYKLFNTLWSDSFKYFPTLIPGLIRNYSPFATHYSSPISDY